MTNTSGSAEHPDGTGAPLDPQGFLGAVANLGVKDDTRDFALVVSTVPATAAGVYTQSRFAGPSVELARRVTANGAARAVAVISKNANVANGDVGREDAAALQRLAAELAEVEAEEVVIASTGVIGRQYPMDTIATGIGAIARPLAPANFDDLAEAIMTTDTEAKVVRAQCGEARIVGIAKGVGMIEPNMATLLTFFFTDAAVSATDLDLVFRSVMDRTFNALSIDTDTSTSDSAAILANGLAGPVDLAAFEQALEEVALALVLKIAGDGEGATKVIEAIVNGARDTRQAKRIAKAIINSPLVKTAVHGADPNWGRVAMAIGKCHEETDIDPEAVSIEIGGIAMYPVLAEGGLEAASAKMRGDHVVIEVDLAVADGSFTAYGCDLTDGYVRINADYTT
jgi:glutamate N-acetyltransferase/amino-acid N-acetyltransferase